MTTVKSVSAFLELDRNGRARCATFSYEVSTPDSGTMQVDLPIDRLAVNSAVSGGGKIVEICSDDDELARVWLELETPLTPGRLRLVELEIVSFTAGITPVELLCYMGADTVSASVTISYPACLTLPNIRAVCGHDLATRSDICVEIAQLDPDTPNNNTMLATALFEGVELRSDVVGLAWTPVLA